MLSFRSLRRPVSLTGERPCSWSWIQRSSLRRWPSRWRSGTGTWWERMTSWERFGCLDFENDNNAVLIRHYVCRTIDFQSYDTEFYALNSSFFSILQVEIPFACLHKTPLLEGWFRLLPLGNHEVDTRWEFWVPLVIRRGELVQTFALGIICVLSECRMQSAFSSRRSEVWNGL